MQGGKPVSRIMCGITPVAGPFHPCTVGAVAFQGKRQRLNCKVDNLLGILRLGFGDCQSTDYHPGIADLVPVVLTFRPPGFLICAEGRYQAVLNEAGPDFFPCLFIEIGIQPVITDSHCVRHLGGVEKVRGIPVLERTDCQQVFGRFFGIFFFACPSVRKAKGINSMQAFPADMKKPGPNLPVSKHRFFSTVIRILKNI